MAMVDMITVTEKMFTNTTMVKHQISNLLMRKKILTNMKKFSLEKPTYARWQQAAMMVSKDGLDHPTHGRLSKMLIMLVLDYTKMIPSGPTAPLSQLVQR